MTNPLINILIRISRHELYKRCIASVVQQTYYHYAVHTYDDVLERERKPYDWNLFCNILRDGVTDGWMMYLDDDDYLASPTVLAQLAPHLDGKYGGVVVQFLRNGRPKPSITLMKAGVIRKGLIGGGCLVLHHSYKDVYDWRAEPAEDYAWIRAVANRVELKFVPLVVQVAGNNGLHGRIPLTDSNLQYLKPFHNDNNKIPHN